MMLIKMLDVPIFRDAPGSDDNTGYMNRTMSGATYPVLSLDRDVIEQHQQLEHMQYLIEQYQQLEDAKLFQEALDLFTPCDEMEIESCSACDDPTLSSPISVSTTGSTTTMFDNSHISAQFHSATIQQIQDPNRMQVSHGHLATLQSTKRKIGFLEDHHTSSAPSSSSNKKFTKPSSSISSHGKVAATMNDDMCGKVRVPSIPISSDFKDFLYTFQSMMNDDNSVMSTRFKDSCSPAMRLDVHNRPTKSITEMSEDPGCFLKSPVSRSFHGKHACLNYITTMSNFIPDRFLSFSSIPTTQWFLSTSLTVSANFSCKGTFVGVVHGVSSDGIVGNPSESSGEVGATNGFGETLTTNSTYSIAAKAMLEQFFPIEEIPDTCKQSLLKGKSDKEGGSPAVVSSPLLDKDQVLSQEFKVMYPFQVEGKILCEVYLPTRKIQYMRIKYLNAVPIKIV